MDFVAQVARLVRWFERGLMTRRDFRHEVHTLNLAFARLRASDPTTPDVTAQVRELLAAHNLA